jgi:phosphoenolpyruvate synthase/pyruvate phosphate dikinase
MNQDLIKKFKHNDWDSQWAGNWSTLSFSYWGPFYSEKPFSDLVDQYVQRSIIIWKNGKSFAYQRHSEKATFAEKIIKKIKQDENLINTLCKDLIKKTDEFLEFVKQNINKDISFEQYIKYQKMLCDYYRPHISIKASIDYLPTEILKKAFSKFEKARVHAEPVFSKSVEFMKAFSKIHAKKTKYPEELIRATTKDEFEKYFQQGSLPDKEILSKRNKECAFLFLEGKTILLGEKETKEIEDLISNKQQGNTIKGTTAYNGKAKGTVKIISDPSKPNNFQKGDILVTGMTRPEYVPLIKKSAAFVTDGGGMLCHAAIVARELKKPCIIGTKIATKVLKEGDQVEVDAENGTVKII